MYAKHMRDGTILPVGGEGRRLFSDVILLFWLLGERLILRNNCCEEDVFD